MPYMPWGSVEPTLGILQKKEWPIIYIKNMCIKHNQVIQSDLLKLPQLKVTIPTHLVRVTFSLTHHTQKGHKLTDLPIKNGCVGFPR